MVPFLLVLACKYISIFRAPYYDQICMGNHNNFESGVHLLLIFIIQRVSSLLLRLFLRLHKQLELYYILWTDNLRDPREGVIRKKIDFLWDIMYLYPNL